LRNRKSRRHWFRLALAIVVLSTSLRFWASSSCLPLSHLNERQPDRCLSNHIINCWIEGIDNYHYCLDNIHFAEWAFTAWESGRYYCSWSCLWTNWIIAISSFSMARFIS
jgi:hypothetical protein